MTSTEGLTATCAAAFGLPNLTGTGDFKCLLNLANNKVKQKRAKEGEKSLLPQDLNFRNLGYTVSSLFTVITVTV